MTIVTSDNQLVAHATLTLPRVNLLPPEIAERRTFRRIQAGLGVAVAAAVVVVSLLFLSASHSVSAAKTDLAQANSQNTALQSQVAQKSNVTATYNAASDAAAQLKTAMGDEVRYSQLLNDLSLSIPGNVWLTNVSFSDQSATPTAAASAPPVVAGSSATAGAPATASPGTLTVSAVAFSHDDLAFWLDSLAALKTYADPYFSSSTEALLGRRKTVNFTSTATLTKAALSGRYNKPVGG